MDEPQNDSKYEQGTMDTAEENRDYLRSITHSYKVVLPLELKNRSCKKGLWPSQTSMANSRRKYLFSEVEEKAIRLKTGEWEEKLIEAAMEFDGLCIPRSLTNYME